MTAALPPHHHDGEQHAWAPLRHRFFRMLFVAQLVSNIGLWMQTVGAQWFLVQHHGSPAVVALVQTASLLPTLLLALPAGGLADLLDRRLLLVVVSTGTALAAALTTVLAWADVLTPGSLLLMTFLLGCGSALSAPAWQAIQPELVPADEIPAASALGSVTVNGARAVGPAIGGAVVAAAGPAAVFGLNALSFLAIIGALLAWPRPAEDRGADRERLGSSILTGVHYVWSAPVVRRIMLRSVLFAFPASALWALLPLASTEHLGLGAAGYGAVLGVLGAGAVGGVAAYPWLRGRLPANGILAGSAAAYALGVVAVDLLPLAAALPALLVSGAAWIGTLTTLNASLQLSLAPWVRARGMSVYLLLFMGSQALGSLLWGLLAARAGVLTALLTSAALLVASALSVRALPLHAATGTLPRGLSTAWPTPTLVLEPDPTDGPVIVVNSYRVAPHQQADFERAMRAVGRARRRAGGHSWGLYRDAADGERRVERFTVRSWREFERQRTQRWTRSDHDRVIEALQHTVDGTSSQQHLIAVPGGAS